MKIPSKNAGSWQAGSTIILPFNINNIFLSNINAYLPRHSEESLLFREHETPSSPKTQKMLPICSGQLFCLHMDLPLTPASRSWFHCPPLVHPPWPRNIQNGYRLSSCRDYNTIGGVSSFYKCCIFWKHELIELKENSAKKVFTNYWVREVFKNSFSTLSGKKEARHHKMWIRCSRVSVRLKFRVSVLLLKGNILFFLKTSTIIN